MKHLHEEAQLIGSMCLGKPRQRTHTADEPARILFARTIVSESSFPLSKQYRLLHSTSQPDTKAVFKHHIIG